MNYSTIENLAAIANACDAAIAALESDGAEPLVLQTWSEQIENALAALTPLPPPPSQPKPTGTAAPAPSAPPQPTGRFSGVRTPGAPDGAVANAGKTGQAAKPAVTGKTADAGKAVVAPAPAPQKAGPTVQTPAKSAPAAKPAPAPAQKTGHLLKITPPPLKRRRMAGM